MPKFAANLSMLWPELDVYDRFGAAAAAGFTRVEILFVHTLDTSRVGRLLGDHGLELVLFDPAPGVWAAGERDLACNPDREVEFQRSIVEALETAQRLRVHRLNVLTGIPRPDVSPDVAWSTLVDSFLWAAPLARSAMVNVLVENINTTDFPGYFVN